MIFDVMIFIINGTVPGKRILEEYSLCDDLFAHIVLYLDFESAVRFLNQTCHLLRHRQLEYVWKYIYHRHYFAPLNTTSPTISYWKECQKRRNLFQQLFSTNKNALAILKNHQFQFYPILPEPNLILDDDDPPPVDYVCTSYVLTDVGTGSEIVLLNPFNGTISIYSNLRAPNHNIDTDTIMANAITDENHPPNSTFLERLSNGEAISDLTNNGIHGRNNFIPSQVLFDVDDYFSLDLHDYFPIPLTEEDDEIFVDWLGIDTHSIVQTTNTNEAMTYEVQGNVIACARILTNERSIPTTSCTEILCWKKSREEKMYSEKFVSRLWNKHPYFIDINAKYNQIYMVEETDRRTIYQYPLLHHFTTNATNNSCQSRKIFCGQEGVSCFSTDCTGTHLIIGTEQSSIHILHTGFQSEQKQTPPKQLRHISIQKLWKQYHSLQRLQRSRQRRAVVPQCPIDRRIHSIVLAQHLPIEKGGMLTLQHDPSEGTTIYLWTPKKDAWTCSAFINPPVSTQRIPQVHYDGKRIILFGQDHIGMILLIYQVHLSGEYSPSSTARFRNDESCGGVVNLIPDQPCVIQYTNRIRHVGLGGLDDFDGIYMTCNERFIIVNTKTGNLLEQQESDHDGASDGLFIIDLLKHSCDTKHYK